ncbi:MAG TPA: hypothetical protein P5556_04205 [Candidatus Gastranaerophilales bacterium]|nr:hypothetical protein [Candidatus Gastranaerophilales bacterium]
MLNLCSCNKIAKTEGSVLNRFDLNNDGEVNDSELAKINLNDAHKSIFSNESAYKDNKYFKRIDANNIKTALDRNKDGIIDIKDFNLLSHYNKINENIFSFIELIALSEAFGEYKDMMKAKVGVNSNYKSFYVTKAEQQLNNSQLFDELFYKTTISSPIPTNPL